MCIRDRYIYYVLYIHKAFKSNCVRITVPSHTTENKSVHTRTHLATFLLIWTSHVLNSINNALDNVLMWIIFRLHKICTYNKIMFTLRNKTAQYVSLIADETSDISSVFQLVIVFRYVLANGQPVESFWKFDNPEGTTRNLLV